MNADATDRAALEYEELLTTYAFRLACEELEKITGTPWEDWQDELTNRARTWIYAEVDQLTKNGIYAELAREMLDELAQPSDEVERKHDS